MAESAPQGSAQASAPDALGAIEDDLTRAAAAAMDRTTPLVERLLALQDEAGGLLSRYGALVHDPREEPGLLRAQAAPDFDAIRADYEHLFATCTLNPGHAAQVRALCSRIAAGRGHYDAVAARTDVPWWFIGLLHAMEANLNFAGHLHNGDPLARRTVHVPKGRPPVWNPPGDWESSALDALQLARLTGLHDWALARSLYRLEGYNGWGYRPKGIHTPYLWSFTNHYEKGKYVADGCFDPNAVSQQCGAAAILKAMVEAGLVAFPNGAG